MPLDENIHTDSHQAKFTEKGIFGQFRDFLSYLPREITTFASVAISCWALAEILIVILDNRPSPGALAFPVIGVAVIAAIYRAYSRYISYIPEPLVSESRKSQSIYRRQKFGWQWALAQEMLLDRIGVVDAELGRIRRGAEFVEPKILSHKNYFTWLRSRPEAIIRLVKAVTMQCVTDLPGAISITVSEGDVVKMKVEIDALAKLYITATAFERDCHAIVAPGEFKSVHEMTYGWTDTIRDGVHDFIDIIAKLATLDKKVLRKGSKELPVFEFNFNPPGNVDEFNRRLEDVDPSVLVDDSVF